MMLDPGQLDVATAAGIWYRHVYYPFFCVHRLVAASRGTTD